MSVLIKSAAAETLPVQSFGSAGTRAAPTTLASEVLFEARIAELEAEIAERDDALPAELERARAEAVGEALKERSDAEAVALKELKKVLTTARATWTERLGSIETSSVGLARAVLAKVFADASHRSEQVANCIKQRLQLLETASVIRARVSRADFSGEQLSALMSGLGSALEIEADAKLKSGSCVIDLKLGHVEVGPDAQWQRISELLDRLERESVMS